MLRQSYIAMILFLLICFTDTAFADTLSEIHAVNGIFDFSEVSYLDELKTRSFGNAIQYDVWLEEGIFLGGSDGFCEEYLTNEGILYENRIDLDADGVKELSLISQRIMDFHTEYGDYCEHHLYLSVYEPEGDGFVFADEVDMGADFGTDVEFEIDLINNQRFFYGWTCIHDGAVADFYGELFGYDGRKVNLECAASVSDGAGSYVYTRTTPSTKVSELFRILEDLPYIESNEVQALNLKEEELLHVEYSFLQGPRYSLEGIKKASEKLAPLGIKLKYKTHQSDDFEYYSFTFSAGHRILSSIVEGDDYRTSACIHFYLENKPVNLPVQPDGSTFYVLATGDVNVRKKPDKSSQSIGVLQKDERAAYNDEMITDERGVVWYGIRMENGVGYVSSKYSVVCEP